MTNLEKKRKRFNSQGNSQNIKIIIINLVQYEELKLMFQKINII